MKKKIAVLHLNVFIKDKIILKDINLDVYENEILSIIGPANSGKSSFLRVINRMLDINSDFRVEGNVFIDGEDIYKTNVNICDLRKRIGIIFALPVPLPLSIYDNLIYGPLLHKKISVERLNGLVEKCLKSASLWEEVKDRLHLSALQLSGGQQQRLCLARSLMVEPEIILFDEPCSGLDPVSTSKVERTMFELKKRYTLILVTNNTKQVATVSDRTAFLLSGKLIEVDQTKQIFTSPKSKLTNDYITGRFG